MNPAAFPNDDVSGPNVFYMDDMLPTEAQHNVSKTKFTSYFSVKIVPFPALPHFSLWQH